MVSNSVGTDSTRVDLNQVRQQVSQLRRSSKQTGRHGGKFLEFALVDFAFRNRLACGVGEQQFEVLRGLAAVWDPQN